MNHEQRRCYTFGNFRIDARRRLLLARADGQILPLAAKAFDALLHLVEHANTLIPKATLMRSIWPDVTVEENSLSQLISSIRRALGEDPAAHNFIVTAPGRGYRFIADVTIEENESTNAQSTMAASKTIRISTESNRSLAVLPFKHMATSDTQEALEQL